MYGKRRYQLDVVRHDGGTPHCSVRYAFVELDHMKAMEIGAMSELKRGALTVGRHNRPKTGVVWTQDEVLWTDGNLKPVHPGFRVSERTDFLSPQTYRYHSLVQIDRKGFWYLWNLFEGNERLRTRLIPVQALLDEFRCHPSNGFEVAEGMRRLMDQQELSLRAELGDQATEQPTEVSTVRLLRTRNMARSRQGSKPIATHNA